MEKSHSWSHLRYRIVVWRNVFLSVFSLSCAVWFIEKTVDYSSRTTSCTVTELLRIVCRLDVSFAHMLVICTMNRRANATPIRDTATFKFQAEIGYITSSWLNQPRRVNDTLHMISIFPNVLCCVWSLLVVEWKVSANWTRVTVSSMIPKTKTHINERSLSFDDKFSLVSFYSPVWIVIIKTCLRLGFNFIWFVNYLYVS